MTKSRHRASHSQRTAVQQVLDDAFAAGRLDHFEHFERTRTATRAKYIDELRPLVDDLRGGNDDLGLGDGGVEHRESHAGHGPHESRRRPGRALTVGLAVGVTALAVTGGAVAAWMSGGPSSSSTPSAPGPLHTTDGVTRMLESARSEFTGGPVDTLTINGSNAIVLQEDPTEPGTRLTHAFRDGQWQETGFHARTDTGSFTIDAVDPADVMAAIEAAPAELDMSGAEISHVFIDAGPLGDPEYRVTLSEDDDLGTAVFGPDGELRETR